MFHRIPSGFMLDFDNGWTASIMFGPGNYGSNRDMPFRAFMNDPPQFLDSTTAEMAACRTKESKWYTFEDGQEVKGWQNVTHVVEFLNMVVNLPDLDDKERNDD